LAYHYFHSVLGGTVYGGLSSRSHVLAGYHRCSEASDSENLLMTDWSRTFDDPIALPDGRELKTLRC
jgi:hypothetical protein